MVERLIKIHCTKSEAQDCNDIRTASLPFHRAGLLMTPLDQCLVRSFALALALRRLEITCNLVIGVKVHPFAAHSWVQSGSVLLNDRIDTVRDFTPILVI